MSTSSRHFSIIILGIALLVILANVIAYRNAQDIQQTFGEADRQVQVLILGQDVLNLLRDAETGQRGFLLTGRDEYLEPYRDALRNLPLTMAQLTDAVSGQAEQKRRVAAIRELAHEKLSELKQTIDLRRSGRPAAALAIVLSNRGKLIMDRIRQLTREFGATESARLNTLFNARQRFAQRARLFALTGSVLFGALVVGSLMSMRAGHAQREKLNTELGRAKELLETTLYSIGDGVIVTDAQGTLTLINSVASQLTGYGAAEAQRRSLHDIFQIINEDSGAAVENPVDQVRRSGGTASLTDHTVLISKGGERIPIDSTAALIRHSGETVGVVLVFRNVTARREAEKDAAYLSAIIQSSDDAIIGNSLDGVIQTWNAGAERIFGYRAEEIIGHSMNELTPQDRQDEEKEILGRLRDGKHVRNFETVRLRKGGAPIDVSLTISPIRDRESRIVGASSIQRDISEHKKNAERMRGAQKLESLGILAGGIAHDFNNLLTAILGNASLALEDLGLGSPTRGRVAAVIRASERAAELTNQMLAYSGKGHFRIDRIDLSKQVGEIATLIRAAVPSTVEVRFGLSEHVPPIEADISQIQQVVMNVVINAGEAIPQGRPGTVTINVRLQYVDDEWIRNYENDRVGELQCGQYVAFEVIDTGSGMDRATRNKVFDPFFTTKFTGRGLGLAAVLGIVRGSGGAIELTSAPGKGTTLRVFFPAVEGLPPVTTETPRGSTSRAELPGCGTILVVDDEEIVRKTAKHALEYYGCRVLLAENGAQALEIFRQEADRIQCVVLDSTMPVMSGEETLERLQALRPDIPVLLSSGYSQADAIRRFEGKGLAGFIQKPYKATELADMVSSVLRAQRKSG